MDYAVTIKASPETNAHQRPLAAGPGSARAESTASAGQPIETSRRAAPSGWSMGIRRESERAHRDRQTHDDGAACNLLPLPRHTQAPALPTVMLAKMIG